MKRREILRYTAYITGAAVSAPLASTLLSGCTQNVTADVGEEILQFFSSTDMKLLTEIVDTILPKTDSPSASDVGVPAMINHMVGNVYQEKDQKTYREGFTTLSKFLGGSSDKLSLLMKLEIAKDSTLKSEKEAYLRLKQQTVAYYLTSEEIGTNYLNYLPVPGAYEACISLEEAGGKAWAI